jgi:hypothetical protein
MRTLLWLAWAGCATPNEEGPEDTQEQSDLWIPATRLVGELRFTYSDAGPDSPDACSYTRSFEGYDFKDYRDLFVGCPDCRGLFAGVSTLDPETAECAERWLVRAGVLAQERVEFWGWTGETFLRVFSPADPIGSFGISPPAAGEEAVVAWTSTPSLYVGALDVSATFTWAEDPDVLVPDPEVAFDGPYACGWPRRDPGDVLEPYAIGLGEVIPGARMKDQCGEPFDLRDLYDAPALFLTARPDCDTCVFQARAAAAFVASQPGTDLAVVTLFEGSDEAYEAAVATYGALGPVLHSRGYVGLMGPYLVYWRPYPAATWWLVDPDQVVVSAGIGTLDFSELTEVL